MNRIGQHKKILKEILTFPLLIIFIIVLVVLGVIGRVLFDLISYFAPNKV